MKFVTFNEPNISGKAELQKTVTINKDLIESVAKATTPTETRIIMTSGKAYVVEGTPESITNMLNNN